MLPGIPSNPCARPGCTNRQWAGYGRLCGVCIAEEKAAKRRAQEKLGRQLLRGAR